MSADKDRRPVDRSALTSEHGLRRSARAPSGSPDPDWETWGLPVHCGGLGDGNHRNRIIREEHLQAVAREASRDRTGSVTGDHRP